MLGEPSKSPEQQVYDQLVSEAKRSTQRESLRRIKSALDEMVKDGVADFSYGRVGEYSAKEKGPHTQSIRNQQGAHFRRLIDAYAGSNFKPVKRTGPKPTNIERIIEGLPNLADRVALRMLLEDRNRKTEENQTLRFAFRRISVDPYSDSRANLTGSETPLIEAGPPKTNSEIDVSAAENQGRVDVGPLERFISETWLEARTLTIQVDGSILDEVAGQLIAPPGFVETLRVVIGVLG